MNNLFRAYTLVYGRISVIYSCKNWRYISCNFDFVSKQMMKNATKLNCTLVITRWQRYLAPFWRKTSKSLEINVPYTVFKALPKSVDLLNDFQSSTSKFDHHYGVNSGFVGPHHRFIAFRRSISISVDLGLLWTLPQFCIFHNKNVKCFN